MYEEQKTRGDLLEKDLQPKIKIVPTSNVDIIENGKGIRTVRLEITNISNSTIRNCRVREIEFINKFGSSANMRRHFRLVEERFADSSKHSYQQTFDLQGYGSSELVEIAQLDETKDDLWVLMLYATVLTAPTLNSIRRDCFPHRLTISVMGDNLPKSEERIFDLKITDTGNLEMTNGR